jgi:hypothetical protein
MVVRNLKMAIQPEHARRHRLAGWLHDAYVRVALLTGAALLVEAVLAMTALDVRGRRSEIAASVCVVVVTVGVLLVYVF